MQTLTNLSAKSSLLALLAAVVACGTAGDAPPDPALGSEEQRIIGGDPHNANTNVVAFYTRATVPGTCTPDAGDNARGFHSPYTLPANTWFPRPCSGIVIRKNGNEHFILTARHCVTQDGGIFGPLIPGTTNIRSTSAVSPGVLSTIEADGSMIVTGTPPATSVQTSVFFQDTAKFDDLALLRADGNLQPPQPAIRVGIATYSASQASTFVGMGLSTLGYGRTLAGKCYAHSATGAGRLRTSSPFEVIGTSTKWFKHELVNDFGEQVAYGDSGGPLFTSQAPAFRIHGVNSSVEIGVGGETVADFVQAAFGFVYLVRLSAVAGSTVVGVNSLVNGAFLYHDLVNDGATRQMKLDRASGQLKLGTFCLADETATGGQATVRLRSCTTAGTAWNITANGVIKNRQTNRCISTSGAQLTTNTCSPATLWTFTADQHFG
jgi:hypothetical protein